MHAGPYDHLVIAAAICHWRQSALSVQLVAEKLPQKLLLPVHALSDLPQVVNDRFLGAFAKKVRERQLQPVQSFVTQCRRRSLHHFKPLCRRVALLKHAVQKGIVAVATEVIGAK